MDKAEKIKAARKKLKEFQTQHKKSEVIDNIEDNVKQDTVPAVASFFDTILPTPFVQNDSNHFFLSSSSAPTTTTTVDELSSQQTISNETVTNSIPESINFFRQEPSLPLIQQTQQHVSDTNMQALIEQQNLQINQLKSEVEFHRMTATNLQKNLEELNHLKQQEQHQNEAIKLLIREKSTLTDAFQKSENIVATLKGENEELHNRLNLSRHRVKQLESMTSTIQQSTPEIDKRIIEETVEERLKDIRKSLETNESEKNELKLLLNQKRIELENLQKNYDHLNNELHLQSIKIAQLSNGSVQPEVDQSAHQLAALTQESAIKQQQLNELNAIIDQLNNEKEASELQYQNYVLAMTTEMDTLRESSVELSNENDALVKREKELLKHVSDLERQIQQQIQKQKIYAENAVASEGNTKNDEEIQKLTSQLTSLSSEYETLKSQIAIHESEKLELIRRLELSTEEINNLQFQMERIKTETPNVSQLMVDFEDKSTAASRALSQNQSLKDQLEELQRAFVTISNDKMELTDKLQSEMHLCKEMKTLHDAMETELSAIKEKWQFKENEMIRLSHENTELEKKILQQTIEIDRLRHYETKDYHRSEGGALESELEHCRHLIESLTNKINILESNHQDHDHDHNHDHNHGHSHNHDAHGHSHNHTTPTKQCNHEVPSSKQLLEEIEMLKMEKSELLKAINDFRKTKPTTLEEGERKEQIQVNSDIIEEMNDEKLNQMSTPPPKSVTPSMATEEALEKLQERFRRTMLEVADLTEEKIRLEHLVTMLQFETETIGEYITLYQNQRRLLKQKEQQRDIELKNLAADRELMNKKLLQLNGLIEKFVLQHTDQVEVAKEATRLLENEPLIAGNNDNNNEKDLEQLKKETAGKILEILSDIKSTNTRNYDSNIGVENSCSCCLGRLETV